MKVTLMNKMKQPTKPSPEDIVKWCRRSNGLVDEDSLSKLCEYYEVEVIGYMVYEPKYDLRLNKHCMIINKDGFHEPTEKQ